MNGKERQNKKIGGVGIYNPGNRGKDGKRVRLENQALQERKNYISMAHGKHASLENQALPEMVSHRKLYLQRRRGKHTDLDFQGLRGGRRMVVEGWLRKMVRVNEFGFVQLHLHSA
jgi:hypothetical protein